VPGSALPDAEIVDGITADAQPVGSLALLCGFSVGAGELALLSSVVTLVHPR
jgi:hypothetical protein